MFVIVLVRTITFFFKKKIATVVTKFHKVRVAVMFNCSTMVALVTRLPMLPLLLQLP